MRSTNEWNFAGRLVARLGDNSELIDVATRQTIPAGDVASLIVGFAAGFLSTGLEPGDRVLISCGLNAASTLAYIGAMYAGCVPVLVDERTFAASGDLVFAKAHAKASWTAKRLRCDWAMKSGFPQIEGSFDSRPVHLLRPAVCAENDLAALMPTSGSTGTPRLVMVSHGNLIANTEAIIRSQYLGTDEKAMLIMPVSYCFGASVVHTHLYQGGGVVFNSKFIFPDKVLQAINTYRCTTLAGVPSVYNILLRRSHLGSIPLPGLRRFLQAQHDFHHIANLGLAGAAEAGDGLLHLARGVFVNRQVVLRGGGDDNAADLAEGEGDPRILHVDQALDRDRIELVIGDHFQHFIGDAHEAA